MFSCASTTKNVADFCCDGGGDDAQQCCDSGVGRFQIPSYLNQDIVTIGTQGVTISTHATTSTTASSPSHSSTSSSSSSSSSSSISSSATSASQTGSSTPANGADSGNQSQKSSSGGLSTGAKAGIGVACGVVCLALIGGAVWFFMAQKKKNALPDYSVVNPPAMGYEPPKEVQSTTMPVELMTPHSGQFVELSGHSRQRNM